METYTLLITSALWVTVLGGVIAFLAWMIRDQKHTLTEFYERKYQDQRVDLHDQQEQVMALAGKLADYSDYRTPPIPDPADEDEDEIEVIPMTDEQVARSKEEEELFRWRRQKFPWVKEPHGEG